MLVDILNPLLHYQHIIYLKGLLMESDSTLGFDWHVNSHYLKWSLETYPSGQNFSLLIDS